MTSAGPAATGSSNSSNHPPAPRSPAVAAAPSSLTVPSSQQSRHHGVGKASSPTTQHQPPPPSPSPHHVPSQPSSSALAAPQQQHGVSPPSKRDLKSWWKGFKLQNRHQESHEPKPQGIFGVPLQQSITYANVAISLVDENGQSYIYGYVPIVVAKCGVFLKEKATSIEGIFRLNGSEKRIKELKTVFDSPDRYGKGLVWDGYTVHDAANVLRRYLNDLPEPVVPLDVYEKFREPLKGATKQGVGDADGPQFVDDFDLDKAIAQYQELVKELPPLNRQLLLYILDLLAVFAAKSDENRMNSQNLAAIFQPGMLSHPAHAMSPEEYRLNQCVIIFLIENQDHFLIGMPGTAADNRTVEEVQRGTPPAGAVESGAAASSAKGRAPAVGLQRSASSASIGAESAAKEGMIRRNKSTSSKRSRQSNGGTSPSSPGLASTPTGGLTRSNTVPSKKSPALPSPARFQGSSAAAGEGSRSRDRSLAAERSPEPSGSVSAAEPGPSMLEPIQSASTTAAAAGRSQERLHEPPAEAVTPSKEKRLGLFQRSPTTESSDQRTPNKLRKKARTPSGAVNDMSAHSSQVSLPYHSSNAVSPGVEVSNPMEQHATPLAVPQENGPSMSPVRQTHTADSSEQTPRASQAPSNNTLQPAADNALRPARSPPASVHSSFNEGSDMDQVEETVAPVTLSEAPAGPEKEKRRLFRWSHRKEDKEAKEAAKEAAATGQQQQQSGLPPPLASPRRMPAVIGSNSGAEISATSIGSLSGGNKARKSLTNEQSDVSDQQQHQQQRGSGDSGRGGELAAAGAPSKEKNERGPIGWIKNKMREAKSDKEKRNKSPPPPSQASASAERTSKDSPQQQQSVATGALTAANIALKPGWVVPGTAGPGTATTMAEKPKSLEIPRGEAAKSTGPLSS